MSYHAYAVISEDDEELGYMQERICLAPLSCPSSVPRHLLLSRNTYYGWSQRIRPWTDLVLDWFGVTHRQVFKPYKGHIEGGYKVVNLKALPVRQMMCLLYYLRLPHQYGNLHPGWENPEEFKRELECLKAWAPGMCRGFYITVMSTFWSGYSQDRMRWDLYDCHHPLYKHTLPPDFIEGICQVDSIPKSYSRKTLATEGYDGDNMSVLLECANRFMVQPKPSVLRLLSGYSRPCPEGFFLHYAKSQWGSAPRVYSYNQDPDKSRPHVIKVMEKALQSCNYPYFSKFKIYGKHPS